MQAPRNPPEIVVGIDFGTTCTGVAYSVGPEWASPKSILHWPGRVGYENRNKVTTAVAYDTRTGFPVTWGFLIDRENDDLDVQDLFKLYLDPVYQDAFEDQPTLDEARKWFTDYLKFLFRAITQHFDESFPRWASREVEFLFSVPTTWKNPAMIAEIESLLKRSGFGERTNHVAKITLTEAEAAAIDASKQLYQKGDVLLVCDAGGGTTDVNILKVINSAFGRTELRPLSWVEGQPIGSTLIDFKVEKLIEERLKRIQPQLEGNLKEVAKKMMLERFETYKCSFGSAASTGIDLFLRVPGMSDGLDFPNASIRDSKMVITQLELQAVFDEQIEKIFTFLDGQIQKLQRSHPGESISFLVMSGGLGGSPYLRQRLRNRYQLAGGANLSNAHGMEILVSPEPQLAVVHGIVMGRIQELKTSTAVYTERCCANSYGIVVRRPYNPGEHLGEDVVIDPRDKQKWAEKQIHWFIRQGEIVSTAEGIKHHYRLKIDYSRFASPWRATLVMSSLPAYQLPKSMKSHGVKPLCSVESILDRGDMKLKNRHWYNLGPKYYRAEFELRVLVGPADLKFQMWGRNGRLSRDHEDIQVQWNATDQVTVFDINDDIYHKYP